MVPRYCCVRPCDSLARQQAAVARWRLEPRLSVLVLAGSLDTANLELGVPGLVVVADTGPGHWPQQPGSLGCPLVRLVASGTVEEGLTRVETVRRIMADIKTKSDNMVLSKQTVTDILSPTPDNGYTKKKEKVIIEILIVALASVFICILCRAFPSLRRMCGMCCQLSWDPQQILSSLFWILLSLEPLVKSRMTVSRIWTRRPWSWCSGSRG